jgi:hypothetical protein
MKLYIDDIRNAPDDSWQVCRTVQSAIKAIHQFGAEITDISFDHDISHQVSIGSGSRPMQCAETFQPAAYYLGLKYENHEAGRNIEIGIPVWIPSVTIHSANPVGAQEIFNILNEHGLSAEIHQLPPANRLETII